MVDRDITGQIKRTSLNHLPALLGISGASLAELAQRVREFDSDQSDDTRQRKALEKLAVLVSKSILIESTSERLARTDLRKREVEALEMAAVAQAYPHAELRNTERFARLVTRLGLGPEQTREQGETRD